MRRRPLLALAVLAAAAPAPAQAARPSNGAPTPTSRVHTFTGTAAGAVLNLDEQTMRAAGCRQPFCDGYVISVPKGLPRGSTIELEVTAKQATGFTDVFVMDPPGVKTYYAGEEGDPSTTVVLTDPVHGDWLVQIWTNALFATSAGTFDGRVELRLPEPPGAP